jgi:serine O-acetyltransferase
MTRIEPSIIRHLRAYQNASNIISRKVAAALHRLQSRLYACDIAITVRIGDGLVMPHPFAVVIHPDAVIGRNVCILQGVTIGVGSNPGLPKIGNFVDVGSGAKILGGVSIGEGAIIGANAVVTDDVPAWSVARGIPARCYPMTETQESERRAHHGLSAVSGVVAIAEAGTIKTAVGGVS